jgi:sugar/nucleoside kinase (ribokinase family)
MKFLVVGHFCFDVLHPGDGTEVERYGGIYNAVAALATLVEQSDAVSPVFGVNRGDYQRVVEHLHEIPNVDTSGIFKFEEPTNRVHVYLNKQEQVVCSKDIARPIPYEKIRRHLSVDGVLVNMVSGFDITLETLDHIRLAIRSHNIPLHFDYHNLTLGVNEHHERFRRPLDDWRRWAFMDDTVQLNEEEIGGLTVERSSEKQTVGHLLTLGVKGVVVTRGEGGATLYYDEHKKVIRKDVDGIKSESSGSHSGSGDMFGAAFLFKYLKGKDLQAAAEFANGFAAAGNPAGIDARKSSSVSS